MLLVEDEPFVREATCHILQSAGFDVLPAADAQEAMKVYEHNGRRIDLLMTDMALPGRNGRQLAHDLRDTSAGDPDPVDVWLRGIRVRQRAARAQNLLPAKALFAGGTGRDDGNNSHRSVAPTYRRARELIPSQTL